MTTTNLLPPHRRAWYDVSTPVAAGICMLSLLLIGLIVGRVRSMPSGAAEPRPVIIIATPLPQSAPPTAVPAAAVAALPPNALRRAVVAYDSPNGSVIGAIEAGRTYQVLARYGNDWLQADVQGSGVVWLKADQVLDLPSNLTDLAPPLAPVVIERPVYVAAPALAQPPADLPYQVDSAPPADVPLSPAQPPAAPAPAVAPAPSTAATPSLQQALAASAASTQHAESARWREEHCFGDQCVP